MPLRAATAAAAAESRLLNLKNQFGPTAPPVPLPPSSRRLIRYFLSNGSAALRQPVPHHVNMDPTMQL